MKKEYVKYIPWMNLNLRLLFSILLILLLTCINENILLSQQNEDNLNLTDSVKKIENAIWLYTSKSEYENIKAISGNKISLKKITAVINGDTVEPERIATRGQTSLNFRRKSYSFNLKSGATFYHGEITESFKRFDVISLSMDKNYMNNRLAFEMMKTCHLFDLFFTFCELRINTQSEGIYMVIERPEDWALKKMSSPLILRRGYEHLVVKIKSGNKNEKEEADKYNNDYKQIYKTLHKLKGKELYLALSNWIDLDAYMRWIAFNFIVRNGDYTDEVYFYIDRRIHKFSIIPWDYDDLFLAAPHEGYAERNKFPVEKLIFSTEDLLDDKIASDPYLYKLYLVQFGVVLKELSPDVLKKAFEDTYSELYPYFSNKEIITMSKYDSHKDANLEGLKSEMVSIYKYLIYSRSLYLILLENEH